jgi:hypothetical protein
MRPGLAEGTVVKAEGIVTVGPRALLVLQGVS